MGVSPFQHTVRVLIGVCLVSWTGLPARARADQAGGRGPVLQCASTGNAVPSGLVVLLPSGEKNDQNMNLQVLSTPFMSGVAVQVNWRDIEPVEGKPDWKQLDALCAAAQSSKKWVHLIMFPGFFSPPWALEGTQSDLFDIQYDPGKGTQAKLPMPWDRVYLERWFSFMKLLSARYATSPAFRMIAAAGATSVSVEMMLPNSPPAHQQWLRDSYTPEKYLAAWEDTLHFYAGAFPHQCISLAAPGIPILGRGERGRPAHERARHEVVARAMRLLGNRLAIQSSDLHAGIAKVEAPDQTGFITGYSGRIITGFEMRSGSQDDIASKLMGAEGPPGFEKVHR
jgi:hypothetical protein